MDRQILFRSGDNGCASYRIPTLLTLPDGCTLAFAEARLNNASDTGTIRVVCRMADASGVFGNIFTAAEDGVNTVGNPSPVYDRDTGILWILCNGSLMTGDESLVLQGNAPRSVLLLKSLDRGRTWEKLDVTRTLKDPGWGWYATGPCHAIQTASGRLIFPCNHSLLSDKPFEGRYISHTVWSDDHGETWHLGGDVGDYTNECALAELPCGALYINMRSYHGEHCRAAAWSRDGGATWSPVQLEHDLPDPVCQGSVLAARINGEDVLLMTNAADPEKRIRLTLRVSRDGGDTWSRGLVLHEGPAAYSDITLLPDGRIGVLCECGEDSPYECLALYTVDPAELR